ncbi:transposase [Streptomyces sp. V4I2]|uniref:transposase n=1 Tax=Streptomyces sp. V4I2 TaxID=3042280 RepID=UPI0027864C6D|nr:SRSO17 transposase [Streptomyces sp. V4I2]
MFAAYATSSGRVLVDRELYLPKSWTSDRQRRWAAKIPDQRGFASKGELARDIVRRWIAAGLPAAWVTADEAYGQDWHFRRLLEQLDLNYVVAVPKSQQIKSLAGIWRINQLIEQALRAGIGDVGAGAVRGDRHANRAKNSYRKHLRRDPRPALHVQDGDVWSFAVAEGEAEDPEVTTVPGDAVDHCPCRTALGPGPVDGNELAGPEVAR